MYREWQIKGGKPLKLQDRELNQKVETVLSSKQSNKRSKDCYNCGLKDHRRNECPFYDEKTKRRAVQKGDSADTAVIAEREVRTRTNAGSKTLN